MPGTFIIIFIGFIVLVAVLGYFGHLAAKRRREALAELAHRLGFRFDPLKRSGAPHWGGPFELFRRGHQYGTKNHLAGMWRGLATRETGLQSDADRPAVPAEIFDYTYYTESTDSKGRTSRHYYTRTVLALELPEEFPGITIKPDSALREFFEFIGGGDIDFESNEFNKRFYVWSDDRKFAYDIVHARMMEFLLRTREAIRDLHLQIVGHRAIIFRERTVDADGVEQLLQFAADFHQRIPDYVKKDHARA
jgi:hypothetical protein